MECEAFPFHLFLLSRCVTRDLLLVLLLRDCGGMECEAFPFHLFLLLLLLRFLLLLSLLLSLLLLPMRPPQLRIPALPLLSPSSLPAVPPAKAQVLFAPEDSWVLFERFLLPLHPPQLRIPAPSATADPSLPAVPPAKVLLV